MIEILLNGLLACILIPDVEEFGQCLDQVVLEYNLSLDEK
jgi:hypothetical protein